MISSLVMSATISPREGLTFAVPLTVIANLRSHRCLLHDHGCGISTTRPQIQACARIHAVMTKQAKTYIHSKKRSVEPRYLRRTGMNTPVVVSKELRDCIGGDDISNRTQILAGLRKYVRENKLWVDGDRKRIVCDERLCCLLHVVGEVDFWDAFRLLKPHVADPSHLGAEYESRANHFFAEYLEQKGAVHSSLKPQRGMDPRGRNSAAAQKQLKEHRRGMFAEVCVEPCLRPLCDGKAQLTRPEVLKCVWAYIKKQKLQDATNGRRIRVTESLRHALRLPDVQWIDSFRLGSYVFKLTSKRRETM